MMHSDDPEEPRLIEPAEALLSDWPLRDKQPSDWEALASSIDTKVRITAKGSTDEELLEPPLVDQADQEDEDREVQRRSHPRMKRPAEGSLTALAQASLAQKHAAAARDEMARALLSQAVKARGEARLQGPSTSNKGKERSASELGSAPVHSELVPSGTASALAQQQVSRAGTAQHERRMWLGVAFGVLGMAAAAIMYIRAQQPEVTAMPLAAAPTAEMQADSTPTESGAAPEPAKVLPDPVPLAAIPLDTEDSAGARVESAPRVASRPSAPQRASARTTVEGPERASAPEAPPPAGPSEPGMMMADSQVSDIPDRPSTGAIQAAVGSVLGAARACVAGHEATSRAAVHFASDGRVTAVVVAGPASGTGAERCIQAALAGARVQPFSRPSYVVNLTVRP